MAERNAEPMDVQLREHAYVTRVYLAKTAEGETLDMVLQPGFWVHCAKQFRVRDVVEILADNGAWEWHGRVTHKGTGEVFFRELYRWERPVGEASAPVRSAVDYKVAWAGRAHKWRITAGAEVIKHSFDDEAQANEWLRQYQAGEIKVAA